MENIEKKIKEILKNRTVIVTGADGFVGSHLAETLTDYGAQVHALVRPISSGMLHNIGHFRDKLTIHRADLTDKHATMLVLKKLKERGDKPIIFHLAAQAHVGESWPRPHETIACVMTSTLNILQSIVDLDLEIYMLDTAGSSEEYGNIIEDVRDQYRFDKNGGLILDECSPINPQSVYAISKVAADFLTRDYYNAYGVRGLVTRMFNNYGPRQNPRFITGTIISQALSKDVIELGYVLSKRDFTFVKDGARGHIHATLFGKPGDLYVYGSGKNISMKAWYELIISVGKKEGYWGDKQLKINEKARGRLGKSEVEELRVDYRKLHKLTGWKPEYSWEEGIKETIKWYAENRERWIGRIDWK